MNVRRAGAALALLAASAGTIGSAAPVKVTTAPLSATGTGDTERPFSLRITTAELTASGRGTAEPVFRPVVVRTETLGATGEAKTPPGVRK